MDVEWTGLGREEGEEGREGSETGGAGTRLGREDGGERDGKMEGSEWVGPDGAGREDEGERDGRGVGREDGGSRREAHGWGRGWGEKMEGSEPGGAWVGERRWRGARWRCMGGDGAGEGAWMGTGWGGKMEGSEMGGAWHQKLAAVFCF